MFITHAINIYQNIALIEKIKFVIVQIALNITK